MQRVTLLLTAEFDKNSACWVISYLLSNNYTPEGAAEVAISWV